MKRRERRNKRIFVKRVKRGVKVVSEMEFLWKVNVLENEKGYIEKLRKR